MNAKYTIMVLILISFSASCAEKSSDLVLSSFSQEIINIIMLQTDLMAIGRFGQTSCRNNRWYREHILCKQLDNSCASRMCHFCTNFDNGTRLLVHYAKEHKNNSENKGAFAWLQHLWRHHGQERKKAIGNVLELPLSQEATWDQCIHVYAGQYSMQNMQACSGNSCLDKSIRSSAVAYLYEQLKEFLKQKDVIAIKTLFLTDIDWFSGMCNMAGDIPNLKEQDVLDIVQLFILKSNNDCWADVIELLAYKNIS